MAVTPLADALLLLAYDDDSGKATVGGQQLDFGLAGAVLAELVLAGRVELGESRVRVVSRTPTGNAVCDGVLAAIADDRKPRKPADLVPRLARGLRDIVLSRLTAQGVVRESQEKVLGFIPVTRYPAVNRRPETDLRERLRAVVVDGAPPDPRTAVLCGLVIAIGMDRGIFPDMPRKEVKRRVEEVAAGEWAGPAVREAVATAQAVATAVNTAVVVSIAVSGS